MEPVNKSPEKRRKVLTSIHDAYTLSYTPECTSEAEKVMVKHFLNTLAEVALAVAARKIREQEEENAGSSLH